MVGNEISSLKLVKLIFALIGKRVSTMKMGGSGIGSGIGSGEKTERGWVCGNSC